LCLHQSVYAFQLGKAWMTTSRFSRSGKPVYAEPSEQPAPTQSRRGTVRLCETRDRFCSYCLELLALCCSSRAQMSPICFSLVRRHAIAKLPCAQRSAALRCASFGNCSPRASFFL